MILELLQAACAVLFLIVVVYVTISLVVKAVV